jgi:hypothetical protein
MGIKKYRKKSGIHITRKKLENEIMAFLTLNEATMESDYKPQSEQWRQLFAKAMAHHVFKSIISGK